jgi:hypothetical protein
MSKRGKKCPDFSRYIAFVTHLDIGCLEKLNNLQFEMDIVLFSENYACSGFQIYLS